MKTGEIYDLTRHPALRRALWSIAALCFSLMLISGCGGGGLYSRDCCHMQALMMVEKIYQNAYLLLPPGSQFPAETAFKMETAYKCPGGGRITVGPVGSYPQCSKHGVIPDAEYNQYLLAATSDVAKAVGADSDATIYIMANYAAAKYYGRPDTPVHDINKAFRHAQECTLYNFAPAQFLLGFSYLNGYGVQVDRTKALPYLQAAAQQGYQPAVAELQALNAPAASTEPSASETPTENNGSPWLYNPNREQSKETPGSSDQPVQSSGSPKGEVPQRLLKAKQLLDSGVLSQEEYEEARRNILKDL